MDHLTVSTPNTASSKAPKTVVGRDSSKATRYSRVQSSNNFEGTARISRRENVPPKDVVKSQSVVKRLNSLKRDKFNELWAWGLGFLIWILFIHSTGVYFFTKGFLLTRLVLKEKSSCKSQVITSSEVFNGIGTHNAGCWHPKRFDKAVIIIVDALRYDFTIPFTGQNEKLFHNCLPFLYETAVKDYHSSFLLPFIADPPTTTLQRLKGLTTGTLPTLVDLGSSFSGTAIEEDNLLIQLRDAGKKIVHLGDDTWTALFPGYFEKEISRSYESFNVWDLNTVDDGITENIMPLLKADKKHTWDVIIAHYLGVDHAGHRYGPDHPAMASKLKQMNEILKNIVSTLDQDTLFVVMGDHGMDMKGDHGGESDDEVQTALWMYSKNRSFGCIDPGHCHPVKSAEERFVNQIDIVPTLALLLGIPIPFNNLGKPIQEAFAGREGIDWKNLALVSRITSATTKKYQDAYFTARGFAESSGTDTIESLWASGEEIFTKNKRINYKQAFMIFSEFSDQTLKVCRNLWARFDLSYMSLGIGILTSSITLMVLYASSICQKENLIENSEPDRVKFQHELEKFSQGILPGNNDEKSGKMTSRGALISSLLGAVFSFIIWTFVHTNSTVDFCLAVIAVSGLVGAFYQEITQRLTFGNPFPKTYWNWLALVFTISLAAGFASNSFTIWEDTITLFFLTTFGISAILSSSRIRNSSDRALGMYHSFVFTILGWVASYSKLCREEQIPYCRSTYYVSSTSSTSAPWQIMIPFVTALILPSIIKSFYTGSRSYEGFAPIWIGCIFRIGLILNAIFWALDAADNAEWLPNIKPDFLKQVRVIIAQTTLTTAIGAGSIAFILAPPCVSVSTTTVSNSKVQRSGNSRSSITILGFANAHGTRYFFLLLNIILCICLLQKPMGAGTLSLMVWQVLALVEIIDLNSITSSSIGPIILALLGSFYFFKTGHQTTLSSIQWESAFIPFYNIRYPYSPILVALNTFGAQVFAASAVPLIVLWKQKPRKEHLFQSTMRAIGWHISYFTVMAMSTSLWAAWLRRHLMLYRIFSPKFMTTAFVLLVVDIISILVALLGFRSNILSMSEVFGWS